MSNIALSGNASGTGTFTIASPNSNSDRTLNLPDAGGTVFVSGQAVSATTGAFSGNVTLGSSVLATPSGSAPSYTCRAWVFFDGTGGIQAGGNVSSVTKSGTGAYTVNFTTAMPDANFAVACTTLQAPNSSSQEVRALNVNSQVLMVATNVAVLSKRTIVGGSTADIDGAGFVAIFR